ncbi:MAG: DUF3365 domain-containing protein [Deltaproteobacteria bacterium]|jgi:PAS domain S-box-containing protein|nr:DUF3365 domain-containing protein [Deltaproteobacteria bacterium]
MRFWQNFRLRTKVNIILLISLAGLLSTSLIWQYRQHQRLVFSEASEKAEIIITEATRTREYISRQLQIGQIELNEDRYGMIPVVVANRIGRLVSEDLTYSIRHTSNRFRNPENAPDQYERKVLERMTNRASLDYVAEVTEFDGNPVFRYLQAAYADSSCLECHGKPDESPQFLRNIYPPEKDQAYNYKIGEVIGAVSVVIPIAQIEKRLAHGFNTTLVTTAGFFCALVICLGLMIRKTVVTPLSVLSQTIDDIRQTGRFTEAISRDTHDEIGDLVAGFNAMVSELKEKTGQLEESETRFRLMTEIARDAIVAFLPNGQMFLFNQKAEKIFGYKEKELLGESFDRLFLPDEESYVPSLSSFIAKAPEQWFEQEHHLIGLRRDQKTVKLKMSIKIIDTGEYPFFIALLSTLDANS